jgi:hypothetical protein
VQIIYGLCRSELLFKRLRCNVEQAPRLTAVSERGDAAGFGGGGGGVTRCGADKGLQGPCIAFLSFVPQPRGRPLVGMYPPPHTACWQPACTLAPSATHQPHVSCPHTLPPAPPPPSAQHLLPRPRVQHRGTSKCQKRPSIEGKRPGISRSKRVLLIRVPLGHVPGPCHSPCPPPLCAE